MKTYLHINILRKLALVSISAFLFVPLLLSQTVITQNVPGSGTFEVPCGVTEITVEVWGAGGAGGGGASTSAPGGSGGGGGGYCTTTITVAEGDLLNWIVGAGGGGGTGAGADGGDTNFGGTTASGGTGGATNGGAAGVGGAGCTTNGVDGAIGTDPIGGDGGASGGGAAGGVGGADGSDGMVGTNPGGGGGGGGQRSGGSERGGNGGDGQLVITFTVECVVDAGSNDSDGPFFVCDGDSFSFATTGYTNPCAGCADCIPELMYALYNAVPPATPDPDVDADFAGVYWTGDNYTDTNTLGAGLSDVGLGGFVDANNTIWFVPITADDGDNDPNTSLSHDQDGDGCFVTGTPIPITLLNPIVITYTESCPAGTLSATITGGYPEFFDGSYTISSTGDGTITQIGAEGETIIITDVPDGGTVSLEVTDDANSCTSIVYDRTVVCAILPVKLTSFTGKRNGAMNSLSWSTAMEIGHSHFDVERSEDGNKFDKIGSVTSNGNTSSKTDYTFDDNKPTGEAYYRLKSIDQDGFTEYFKTIHISRKKKDKELISNFYPNPVNDNLTININQLTLYDMASVKISILNIQGEQILQSEYQNNVIEINTSEFAGGMYFIVVKSNQNVEVRKFTKS